MPSRPPRPSTASSIIPVHIFFAGDIGIRSKTHVVTVLTAQDAMNRRALPGAVDGPRAWVSSRSRYRREGRCEPDDRRGRRWPRRLEAWCLNVGIGVGALGLDGVDLKEWNDTFAVNLTGPMLCCRKALSMSPMGPRSCSFFVYRSASFRLAADRL